jgi:DNA polymerase-3 subunit alpha
MTDGSERPIEEIRLRDWVLTAEGRQGQVRQLMTREAPALMRLVLWGHKHLTATPDHPVLTRRGYVPMRELTGDDWVCLPRFMPGMVAAVRTEELVRQPSHRISASRRFAPSPTTGVVVRADAKPLPEKIDLTLGFGRLIGLFLAEGSCDESRVVWTFNIEERDTLAAEVMKDLEELFGLEPRLVLRPKKHTSLVVLFGRNWSRLFSALCGNGAGHKRLLPALCGGPTDFLDGVLSGWLAGDGHYRRGTVTGTTISSDLALGMFDIAMGLGYAPSITQQPSRMNRQPRWDVTVPIAVANSYRLRQEESCIWRRVRFVEEVPGGNGTPVYNLSVAGDESYVAEGIGVHNCAGHIQFQQEADRAGIKPIFGIETYFQPDRLIRPPDTGSQRSRLDALTKGKDTLVTPEIRALEREVQAAKDAQKTLARGRHLILLAQGDKGLHDLWAASTEAFATGFYHKPRMDWNLLEERGSDLIATTSCLGGMLSQDLLAGRFDEAWATLDRLRATFGDRLYLEIQANELPLQMQLNEMLALMSEQTGVPLIAACDAHYPAEEDKALHKLWMLCQSGSGKDDYWHFSAMLSEQRVREMLAYLDPKTVDAAIRNTTEVASRCTAKIEGYADPPVFTPGGTADDDARRLRELCEANWGRIKNPGQDYRDRMEFEFATVASKGLAGCYLIVEDIVRWVRDQGWLVGPGRGSAAGSLMSYLCDITSIDPLQAGLMFERFLTPGRVSLPDFDLDFASSKRTAIQDYAIRTYGADHVVRVGTVMRYGAKGILNKLFSVLADKLPEAAVADSKQIAGLIDEAEIGTAGLGLPWDEIVSDQAIADFVKKYEVIFQIAQALHGRLYALGQHPAGLIISPGRPLAGTMPMRTTDTSKNKGLLVSQWDYRAADEFGYLKLDFLTLRNLDSAQVCIDLIEQRTGERLDPRNWDIEHEDPQVFDDISTGDTLGIFQLETSLCKDYCRRHQPRTIGHLADLTTYIRPGPRNSGATEQYLRRRAGLEEDTPLHPLLAEHLSRSYGVMLYQEDILFAVRVLAGYDDLEADGVRKILGKKLTAKIAAAGDEFVRRCTERGHDEAEMRAIWEKIAEFGKYAFNRAHAYSYATLSYWTAWLRTHYPVEMTAAILSTVDMDRMADFSTEARRKGIAVLPPDVRFSGADFAIGPLSIRYGLSAIPKVGPQAIARITAHQPYASYEDFVQRSGVNAGVLYALARAGALDALVASRRGLVRLIEADRDGSSVRCIHTETDPLAAGPNGLPCSYDWENEPQPPARIGARGKPLKLIVKPPPAQCRRSCRRYTPPASMDPAAYSEYRPDELFRQDFEAYGCWMSDAPFEQLNQLAPGMRDQARHIALMLHGAPEGSYPMAAIYAGAHTARTKAGNIMWWVNLITEVSALDLACFSPRRDDEIDVPSLLRQLRVGTLVNAEVVKRSYTVPGRGTRMGWRLTDIWVTGS